MPGAKGARARRRRSSVGVDNLTPHHTIELAPDTSETTVFFDALGGLLRGTTVDVSLELVLAGTRIFTSGNGNGGGGGDARAKSVSQHLHYKEEVLSLLGEQEAQLVLPAWTLEAPKQMSEERATGTLFHVYCPNELLPYVYDSQSALPSPAATSLSASERESPSNTTTTTTTTTTVKNNSNNSSSNNNSGSKGDTIGDATGRVLTGAEATQPNPQLLLQITDGVVHAAAVQLTADETAPSAGAHTPAATAAPQPPNTTVFRATLPSVPTTEGVGSSSAVDSGASAVRASLQRRAHVRVLRAGARAREGGAVSLVEVARSPAVALTPSPLEAVPLTRSEKGLQVSPPEISVAPSHGTAAIVFSHDAPLTCLFVLRLEPPATTGGANAAWDFGSTDAEVTLTAKHSQRLDMFRPTIAWLQENRPVPVVPLGEEAAPARPGLEYITDSNTVWVHVVGDRLRARVCSALVPVNLHVSALDVSKWRAADVDVQGQAVDVPQLVVLGVGWRGVDLRLSVPQKTQLLAFYWDGTLHSTLPIRKSRHVGIVHTLPFDDLHAAGAQRHLLAIPLPATMTEAAGTKLYVTGHDDVPDAASLESFPNAAHITVQRPEVQLSLAVTAVRIVYADRRRTMSFVLDAPTLGDDEDSDGGGGNDDDSDSSGAGDSSNQRGETAVPAARGGDVLELQWMASSDIVSDRHEVDVNDMPGMRVRASVQCGGGESGGETILTTSDATVRVPVSALEAHASSAIDVSSRPSSAVVRQAVGAKTATFVVAVQCSSTGAAATTHAFGWRPSASAVRVSTPEVMSRRWYSVHLDLLQAAGIDAWSEQRWRHSAPPALSGAIFVWPTHEVRELDPRLGLPEAYLRQHMQDGNQPERSEFFSGSAGVTVKGLAASHTYSYALFLKSEGVYFW